MYLMRKIYYYKYKKISCSGNNQITVINIIYAHCRSIENSFLIISLDYKYYKCKYTRA